MSLLNFNFLAILNLFIILLGAVPGYYTGSRPAPAPAGSRMNVFGVIMLILTVIAVILDIVFMVVAVVH